MHGSGAVSMRSSVSRGGDGVHGSGAVSMRSSVSRGGGGVHGGGASSCSWVLSLVGVTPISLGIG